MSSALVPLTFRDAVYALPEQQTFPVMFYRTDILAEKGLAVPQTWNDVARLIPDLQKEHMNFGLPISDPRARQAGSGDIGVATSGAGSLAAHQGVVSFLTFLYQKGGELYLEDGIATNLDSEIAVEAFREWTDLYELYNLPQQYDAVNRFRTGDIPILIASYTMCNQLSVAAPEIRGRWDFTLVPGTRREDGTIDRSVPGGIVDMSSGAAAIILSSAKNKEDAWEFLKWWTSAETQLRYGRELESLLGPAARYPTANVEAMSNLPWTVEELDKLFQQWSYVRGVPEVPGGYMVGRHLDNAFRKVVLHKAEPRKTLLDYARVVNEEITVKRREFGLETMAERKDSQ
jgi:ABC-type glycerol-3-phosphate transport system substrate-binding protein